MPTFVTWLGCAVFLLSAAATAAQRLPASDVDATTTAGAADRRPMAPPVVYVAADGSGDFNIDGRDDQVEINQALAFVAGHRGEGYTTVRLQGRLGYRLSAPGRSGSGTILTGDGHVCLSHRACELGPNEPIATIEATGAHDIVIHGFEIDATTKTTASSIRAPAGSATSASITTPAWSSRRPDHRRPSHVSHNNMNDMFK